MVTVDPFRAILAAGIVAVIGIVIFLMRNRKKFQGGGRKRQSYE